MAKSMFKGKLFYEGYDLSAAHQSLNMVFKKEELDATTIECVSKKRLGGLKDWELTHSGLNEQGATAIETLINADFIGTTSKVVSFCPGTGVYEDNAYSGKGMTFNYSIGGKVGELQPFDGAMFGRDVNAFRGTVMEAGEKSSSGTGTIKQLGAVGETQKLYGVLHITAINLAPTATLIIYVQSASTQGFGSPSNRITFTITGNTEVYGEYATPISGAITDTWWRIAWTKGGTGDAIVTILVNVGIQ